MQRTGRRDFESVVVHREPDRTTAERIIPVAQGVRHGFSCSVGRVEGLVNAPHAPDSNRLATGSVSHSTKRNGGGTPSTSKPCGIRSKPYSGKSSG